MRAAHPTGSDLVECPCAPHASECSTAAAVATATALPGGTLELTRQFVLERDAVEFQGAEGDVVEQLDTVLDTANTLVQRFVFFGLAQAMTWLKQNFSRDVLMNELAASVHMSPSTFRQHFRNLAGMSPVQYQRQLRLQQARQLMLNQALDASTTAARVGYESASQFSRDYSRLFGAPPQRDIKRMQHLSLADAEPPTS